MDQDTNISSKVRSRDAWFSHYVHACTPYLIKIAAVYTAANVFLVLLPWPLKLVVDSGFGYAPAPGFLDEYTQSEQLVYISSGLIVVIFAVYFFMLLLRHYVHEKYLFKMKTIINRDYYLHILRLPRNVKALHDATHYEDRLIKDVTALSELLVTTFAKVIDAISMVAVVTMGILLLNAKLAIIGPILAAAMFFIANQREKRTQRYTEGVTLSKTRLDNFVKASLKGSHTVQAFNHEATQDQQYYTLLSNEYKATVTRRYLDTVIFAISGSLIAIATALVVFVGGRQFFEGDISSGNMLLTIFYFCLMYPASQKLHECYLIYKATQESSKLVFDDIFDLPEEISTAVSPVVVGKPQGKIVYKDVEVHYGAKQLLNAVNLTINPGQRIAILGPSGSGKSTLLGLPPRISTLTSGIVTLDDLDVQAYDIRSLRNQFAYVEQNPMIFADTIYANVAYGKPDSRSNYAEATAALGAARSYDFVKQLPKGFDTIIGDGGMPLTGTQEQGIAIARAFLKNAPILLLDEPLSTVDAADMKAAIESLTDLMSGKTVLLVSRNIDLLKKMDAVYVIEDGYVRNVNEYGGLDAYHDVLLSLTNRKGQS